MNSSSATVRRPGCAKSIPRRANFWPACRRLAYALLGSLAGGILGLLAPGTWGVAVGILVPLGIFAALAAAGKIVPPCPGPISISSPPDSQ